jgi:hypothetical protein
MDKTKAALALKAAERKFRAAHRAEMNAVSALGDKSTPAQILRCWSLAGKANEARNAVNAARRDLETATAHAAANRGAAWA